MALLSDKVSELHTQRQIDSKMIKKLGKSPELDQMRLLVQTHAEEKKQMDELNAKLHQKLQQKEKLLKDVEKRH